MINSAALVGVSWFFLIAPLEYSPGAKRPVFKDEQSFAAYLSGGAINDAPGLISCYVAPGTLVAAPEFDAGIDAFHGGSARIVVLEGPDTGCEGFVSDDAIELHEGDQ